MLNKFQHNWIVKNIEQLNGTIRKPRSMNFYTKKIILFSRYFLTRDLGRMGRNTHVLMTNSDTNSSLFRVKTSDHNQFDYTQYCSSTIYLPCNATFHYQLWSIFNHLAVMSKRTKALRKHSCLLFILRKKKFFFQWISSHFFTCVSKTSFFLPSVFPDVWS